MSVKNMKDAYMELVTAMESIRKKYNSSQKDNYPTAAWLAGKFQQLTYIDSIESSLQSGNISNIKQEEYEKIVALKNIAIKYGLIKRDGKKYVKTDAGSKFIQSIANSFSAYRDMATKLREIGDEENNEWVNSLSDEERNYVKIYSELSPKEYAYLMGLIAKQQSKKNYSNTLDKSMIENPEIVEKLQYLNLINSDLTLNLNLIKNLLEFLDDKTYARLRSFNKQISYITDRISADRALLRNYIERNLDRSSHRRNDMAQQSDDIIDKLNAVEINLIKKAYKGQKLTTIEKNRLNDLNIMDDDTFTDIGKYIAAVLTSNLDIDRLSKSGEKPTQYSRLHKSEVDGENNKATRMQDKAHTRNLSFKNFLKSRN